MPPPPPPEAPPGMPPSSSSPVEFQLEGTLGSSTDSTATNWPNDPTDPYGKSTDDWARFEYVKDVAPPLNPMVGPLPSVPTQGDAAGEAQPGGPQQTCPTCGAPFQPCALHGAPTAPAAAVLPAPPARAQWLVPDQDMNGEWEAYLSGGHEWLSHRHTRAWMAHPRRARVYQFPGHPNEIIVGYIAPAGAGPEEGGLHEAIPLPPAVPLLSLIHISEPTRQEASSYAVVCV